MKRIITTIMVSLIFIAGFAGEKHSRIEKDKLVSIVSECRAIEGADVVKVGSFGTAAIKSLIRSAADDKDTKKALGIINGIRSIAIIDFEECSNADKERVNRRIGNALKESELLMEMKDGDDIMRMYGIVEEGSASVRDFVLYTPGDCALICLFGRIPMDLIMEAAR